MWDRAQEVLWQSVAQVLTEVANLLPRLVGFAVALLVGGLLAWILGAMVRRSLASLDFDNRIKQWGLSELADWSPSRSPTRLLAGLVSWSFLLLGLLVGISALYPDLILLLLRGLFGYLPSVLAAVLILVGGILLARYLSRGVLISAVNMHIPWARLASLSVKWLILVLAGAMALDHLRIGGQIVPLAFTILFGGIVLALALAIGLGSKDIVSRSWERQTKSEEQSEEPFYHL